MNCRARKNLPGHWEGFERARPFAARLSIPAVEENKKPALWAPAFSDLAAAPA
jgi:hypothetical protein